MRINSISPLQSFKSNNIQTKNKNIASLTSSELPSMPYYNIPFQAATKMSPEKLLNEPNKIVYNKMISLIKKLPATCKICKPIIFNTENSSIGIMVDKTFPEVTKVIIKDGMKSLEDWKTLKVGESRLSMSLDSAGKMISGEYEKQIKSTYTDIIGYEQLSKLKKQITLNGCKFKPNKGCVDTWTYYVNARKQNQADKTIDLSARLEKSDFSEIFVLLTHPDMVVK